MVELDHFKRFVALGLALKTDNCQKQPPYHYSIFLDLTNPAIVNWMNDTLAGRNDEDEDAANEEEAKEVLEDDKQGNEEGRENVEDQGEDGSENVEDQGEEEEDGSENVEDEDVANNEESKEDGKNIANEDQEGGDNAKQVQARLPVRDRRKNGKPKEKKGHRKMEGNLGRLKSSHMNDRGPGIWKKNNNRGRRIWRKRNKKGGKQKRNIFSR